MVAGRDQQVTYNITLNHFGREVVDELTRVCERQAEKAGALSASASEARLQEFLPSLVAALDAEPGTADAFAQPAFAYDLEAIIGVSQRRTDSAADEFLARLVRERIQSGDQPRKRLILKRACQAVEHLSAPAMVGLTALYVSTCLVLVEPADPEFVRDEFMRKIDPLVDQLPSGRGWLDDLLLADLVERVQNRASDLVAVSDFGRYLRVGISAGSVELADLRERFPAIDALLVPHPFLEGFLLHRQHSDHLFRQQAVQTCGHALTHDPSFTALWPDHARVALAPSSAAAVRAYIRENHVIARFDDWWRTLPAVDVTTVGKAIAFVNAKSYLEDIVFDTVADLVDALDSA